MEKYAGPQEYYRFGTMQYYFSQYNDATSKLLSSFRSSLERGQIRSRRNLKKHLNNDDNGSYFTLRRIKANLYLFASEKNSSTDLLFGHTERNRVAGILIRLVQNIVASSCTLKTLSIQRVGGTCPLDIEISNPLNCMNIDDDQFNSIEKLIGRMDKSFTSLYKLVCSAYNNIDKKEGSLHDSLVNSVDTSGLLSACIISSRIYKETGSHYLSCQSLMMAMELLCLSLEVKRRENYLFRELNSDKNAEDIDEKWLVRCYKLLSLLCDECLREARVLHGSSLDSECRSWSDQCLFVNDLNKSDKFREEMYKTKSARFDSEYLLFRSLIGQRIVLSFYWGHTILKEFAHDGRLRKNRLENLGFTEGSIPKLNMNLLSTRSLSFYHWLRGRESIIDTDEKLEELSELNVSDDNVRVKHVEVVYAQIESGFSSLYWAIRHSNKLAENGNELFFPPTALILSDLCYNRQQNKDVNELNVRNQTEVMYNRVGEAGESAYGSLSYTMNSAYREHLKSESFINVDSEYRTGLVRKRHFLHNDFEEPEFSLNWLLSVVICPVCSLYRSLYDRLQNIEQ